MKVFKKQEKYVIEYDSIKKDQLNINNDIQDIGDLSDGYHTFNELYEFRKIYNAALFNEWFGFILYRYPCKVNFQSVLPWFRAIPKPAGQINPEIVPCTKQPVPIHAE